MTEKAPRARYGMGPGIRLLLVLAGIGIIVLGLDLYGYLDGARRLVGLEPRAAMQALP